MYVSTVRSVLKAMGGRLEIRAVFPDHGTVEINRFAARKTSARSLFADRHILSGRAAKVGVTLSSRRRIAMRVTISKTCRACPDFS
jgi:hypothetical protein